MRRVRSQIIRTQLDFPAVQRNSPPQMAGPRGATARESPVPSNLFPCRSRRESKRSNRSLQHGRQLQTRAASPPSGQSFRRIALPSPTGSATPNFLFPILSALTNSPHVAAVRPTRIPLPDSLQPPRATPPPRSSPYPTRKRSALATHSLHRAMLSRTRDRPVRALRRRAALGRASPSQSHRVPLPQIPPRQSGIATQALAAGRTAPLLRHPQSESSSSPLLASRQSNHKPGPAAVRHGTLP